MPPRCVRCQSRRTCLCATCEYKEPGQSASPPTEWLRAGQDSLLGSHRISRAMNGFADSVIGTATANIAAHDSVDLRIGRMRVVGKQNRGRHDLPGLAIATLRNLNRDPGVLQRVVMFGAETLDSDNLLPHGPRHWRDARADGFSLKVNRTGATLCEAASEFSPGEIQVLAQDP